MSRPFLTLRSTIPTQWIKARLFKGTLLSLCGALLLLGAGLMLAPQKLESIGLPLFLISLGLIGWGLIPYKKLAAKAQKPALLQFFDAGYVVYSEKNSSTQLPLEAISKIRFLSTPSYFGIAIYTFPLCADEKRPSPAKKVDLLSPRPSLFLSFFSERSFDEWRDGMQDHSLDTTLDNIM